MKAEDVLAVERFRTVIAQSVSDQRQAYSLGLVGDPFSVADVVVDRFATAHFEYRTNSAGVKLRRVVVTDQWEADPSILPVTHGG